MDCSQLELTLMELVSLTSLLMSKASPLSFQGLCCSTMPSPPQLYRVREGLSPSPPGKGKLVSVSLHQGSCFHSNIISTHTILLTSIFMSHPKVGNDLTCWDKVTLLPTWKLWAEKAIVNF